MPKRKHRSQSQWRAILQHFKESKLTPVEFCLQESLNLKYFLKRKRGAEIAQISSTTKGGFVKIKQPSAQLSPMLTLQYHNTKLHIEPSVNPQWLAQLMKHLS